MVKSTYVTTTTTDAHVAGTGKGHALGPQTVTTTSSEQAHPVTRTVYNSPPPSPSPPPPPRPSPPPPPTVYKTPRTRIGHQHFDGLVMGLGHFNMHSHNNGATSSSTETTASGYKNAYVSTTTTDVHVRGTGDGHVLHRDATTTDTATHHPTTKTIYNRPPPPPPSPPPPPPSPPPPPPPKVIVTATPSPTPSPVVLRSSSPSPSPLATPVAALNLYLAGCPVVSSPSGQYVETLCFPNSFSMVQYNEDATNSQGSPTYVGGSVNQRLNFGPVSSWNATQVSPFNGKINPSAVGYFTTKNGYACGGGISSALTVNCFQSSTMLSLSSSSTSATCAYYFNLNTPAACPGSAAGTLKNALGTCLSVQATPKPTISGAPAQNPTYYVEAAVCNGSPRQLWTLQANGALLNPALAMCLNSAGNTVDGSVCDNNNAMYTPPAKYPGVFTLTNSGGLFTKTQCLYGGLPIPAGSTALNTATTACNPTSPNQQWTFTPV